MKKLTSALCVFSLAASLAGCGASSAALNRSAAAMPTESSEQAVYDSSANLDSGFGQTGGSDVFLPAQNADRKIIYTTQLNVETRDFDSSHSLLRQAASDLGGYLESSTTYGSAENGNRSASDAYRIPAEHYQEFLNAVGDVGSITYRSEQTEDITSQYVDVQARLDSLNAQRTRLEELRAQADNLEDLLTIESQLSDVQYQIESYTAQQKLYDNQVNYCTLDVDLSEVNAYTPANTFASRLSAAFGNSFSSFISFWQDLAILLIYALPYLIVFAVLAILLRLAVKHRPRLSAKSRKGSAGKTSSQSGAESFESPDASKKSE